MEKSLSPFQRISFIASYLVQSLIFVSFIWNMLETQRLRTDLPYAFDFFWFFITNNTFIVILFSSVLLIQSLVLMAGFQMDKKELTQYAPTLSKFILGISFLALGNFFFSPAVHRELTQAELGSVIMLFVLILFYGSLIASELSKLYILGFSHPNNPVTRFTEKGATILLLLTSIPLLFFLYIHATQW